MHFLMHVDMVGAPHVKKFAESQITDSQLENAKELFSFNTPTTKEGYLYRQIFESLSK